jgi:hypothetical protein
MLENLKIIINDNPENMNGYDGYEWIWLNE